jgi:hypothetical protein
MVRLDQEWCYMAMRIMNVQIVRFFSGKIERVCWQFDRQTGLSELLGLSEPLPYHSSSLLIIYIKLLS